MRRIADRRAKGASFDATTIADLWLNVAFSMMAALMIAEETALPLSIGAARHDGSSGEVRIVMDAVTTNGQAALKSDGEVFATDEDLSNFVRRSLKSDPLSEFVVLAPEEDAIPAPDLIALIADLQNAGARKLSLGVRQ